jgi:hypothetical protein
MKRLFFIVVSLFLFNNLFAQEYASDKGAMIINGSASFSSMGGQLYEDSGHKRTTNLSLIPSVDYFLLRNLFVGGTLEYTSRNQSGATSYTAGVGPDIGYVAGKPESKVFPFITTGLLYLWGPGGYSTNEYFIGVGVIVPVQKHIGITFGATYHSEKINNTPGDIFAMTVGLNGLLYKQ